MHKSMAFCALLTAATGLLLGGCATTDGYGAMHTPAARMAAAQSLPTAADDQVMYLRLIDKMQKRGSYYASLAHIDAYEKRYGMTPRLAILRADALRETNQPDAAAAIYREQRQGPEAAAAWHGLGLVAAARGQYTQAAKDLAQAVQRAPINATYLGDLGYARLQTGDLTGARAPLAKAAELQPDNDKTVANLALLLMAQGHTDTAQSMMDRAKLPSASRRAVWDQAAQLRRQQRSNARTTPRQTHPGGNQAANAPSRLATSTSDNVPRRYGISANILDRFHTQPASQGASHEQP